MRIGLVDVDGHRKKAKWGGNVFPNLALCKIAAYHKQQGDIVEWADQMTHYDIVYMAKVFNFSPNDLNVYDADKIIRGGTGYDITSKLPQAIDDCQPDLSIYPMLPQDTSYGFLSRGCPNKCKWCVVPRKEGAVHPYWDIDRVANGRKKVVLMDNNILALPDYAKEQLSKIIDRGYRIDFNQALDARLVTDELAALLAKCRWLESRIRFGCDTPQQVKECDRAIELIAKHGYKGQFFLYTMLHGDIHECYNRIKHWRDITIRRRRGEKINACYPHAQPFRDLDNPSNYPPNGKRTWPSGAINVCCFSRFLSKSFRPAKASCAKVI